MGEQPLGLKSKVNALETKLYHFEDCHLFSNYDCQVFEAPCIKVGKLVHWHNVVDFVHLGEYFLVILDKTDVEVITLSRNGNSEEDFHEIDFLSPC